MNNQSVCNCGGAQLADAAINKQDINEHCACSAACLCGEACTCQGDARCSESCHCG